MNELNTKIKTIAIFSNFKIDNNNIKKNEKYTVKLDPICVTKDTFKQAFYPSSIITPNEFLELTDFNYYTKQTTNNNTIDTNDKKSLSLYNEALSIFKEYNNISSENSINPKLLIDFTNDILKYKNFVDIPFTLSCLSWSNILDWIFEHNRSDTILCLKIEFHYYNKYFMEECVTYEFSYYIC